MNPLFHELEKYNGWRKYLDLSSIHMPEREYGERYKIHFSFYYDAPKYFGKTKKTLHVSVFDTGYVTAKDAGAQLKNFNEYFQQIKSSLNTPNLLTEIETALESSLESVKDAVLLKVHKYLSEKV